MSKIHKCVCQGSGRWKEVPGSNEDKEHPLINYYHSRRDALIISLGEEGGGVEVKEEGTADGRSDNSSAMISELSHDEIEFEIIKVGQRAIKTEDGKNAGRRRTVTSGKEEVDQIDQAIVLQLQAKMTEEEQLQQLAAQTAQTRHVPKFVEDHRRYVCFSPGCGMIMYSVHNLIRHLCKLHSGEFAFHCPHCPADTRDMGIDEIDDHLRLHGTCLYGCTGCLYLNSHLHEVEGHVIEKHTMKEAFVVVLRESDTLPCATAVDATSSSATDTYYGENSLISDVYRPVAGCSKESEVHGDEQFDTRPFGSPNADSLCHNRSILIKEHLVDPHKLETNVGERKIDEAKGEICKKSSGKRKLSKKHEQDKPQQLSMKKIQVTAEKKKDLDAKGTINKKLSGHSKGKRKMSETHKQNEPEQLPNKKTQKTKKNIANPVWFRTEGNQQSCFQLPVMKNVATQSSSEFAHRVVPDFQKRVPNIIAKDECTNTEECSTHEMLIGPSSHQAHNTLHGMQIPQLAHLFAFPIGQPVGSENQEVEQHTFFLPFFNNFSPIQIEVRSDPP